MNLASFGPLSLTLFASLVIALVLLAIRIVVMQRVQQRRQRENRQETERLKSLVAAYRALAGSFSPATVENASQMEETLAEIVLFGSLPQVELAASCARAMRRGESPDYQPLVEELRSDLRRQLGLDPIPDTLVLPVSGPGRSTRTGRGEGEGGGGRGGAGGGGGGGRWWRRRRWCCGRAGCWPDRVRGHERLSGAVSLAIDASSLQRFVEAAPGSPTQAQTSRTEQS